MNNLTKNIRPHAVRDYLISRTEASRPTYELAIRRALAVLAECPIEQIEPAYLLSDNVIQNFQNLDAHTFELMLARLRKKYSTRTAALTGTAVRGVIKKLRRERNGAGQRLIDADDYLDIMDVELPAPPKDRDGRTFLESQEETALLEACKDGTIWGLRDAAMLYWMLTQGARAAEVCAAQLRDYDPESGVVLIPCGKGSKARKNQLANGAKAAMDAWIAVRGSKPGPLFTPVKYYAETIIYNRNLSTMALSDVLKKRQALAGLNGFTPHSLRRTAGDRMAQQLGLEIAAQILGHSDINTTRQNYTQAHNREALEACKNLNV